MSFENTGRLFKNDKKSDNSPDYTGDFTNEDGVKMRVAAWVKPGTQGRANWLSFKVSEFEDRETPEPANEGDAF